MEYLTVPGWMTSTENVRVYEDLPENARKYVELIEDQLRLPGNELTFNFGTIELDECTF